MRGSDTSTRGPCWTDLWFTTTLAAEEGAVKTHKPKKAKAQPKPKNSPKKPVNTPKIDSNPTDGTEFDLRKAVIYAELMTPKFKDEEF